MPTDAPAPPEVGTVEEYSEAPFERRREWAREADVGRIVGERVDHHLVTHPEYVETVLVGEADAYRKPSGVEMYGEGLLGVSGEQWRAQRTALQDAFSPAQVRSYAGGFRAAADALVDAVPAGEAVDVWSLATDATMDLLVRSLFGADADPEPIAAAGEPVRAWFRAVLSSGPLEDGMQADYEAGLDALRDELERLVTEGGDEETVLSALVAADERRGVGYDDERLRDELLTQLFSAHERIAATLTYLLYLLTDAPAVEERLASEFGARGVEARRGGEAERMVEVARQADEPVGTDPGTLPYARCVLDETLRLYPPSEAIFREVATETTLGGYALREGDVVCCSQWDVHHDERWWDDPMQFRPGRFARESDRPRFAHFPFGGGRHHCIGERFTRVAVAVLAAALLGAYSFERGTEELSVVGGQTVVPDGPVELVARRR